MNWQHVVPKGDVPGQNEMYFDVLVRAERAQKLHKILTDHHRLAKIIVTAYSRILNIDFLIIRTGQSSIDAKAA